MNNKKSSYRESKAAHCEIEPCAFIDDGVFVTKSGAVGLALKFNGPDSECLDAPDLSDMVQRFDAAIRVFPTSCRIYQYLIKRRLREVPYTPGAGIARD